MPVRVTLDTNVLPIADLRAASTGLDLEFAVITVTSRELENTRRAEGLREIEVAIPETLIFGEGRWGEAAFASAETRDRLPAILGILSNGAWPFPEPLSSRQRNLLRDALILEAHVRDGRDVLVSNDERAFIRDGRRQAIESQFRTRVLTRMEFLAAVRGDPGEAIRRLTRRCS